MPVEKDVEEILNELLKIDEWLNDWDIYFAND